MKRAYISIYFKDLTEFGKAKAYLTVAFDPDSQLYKISKKLGAAGIKKIINCPSYKALKAKAALDNRTINNFIKNTISKKLKIQNAQKNIAG